MRYSRWNQCTYSTFHATALGVCAYANQQLPYQTGTAPAHMAPVLPTQDTPAALLAEGHRIHGEPRWGEVEEESARKRDGGSMLGIHS